MALPTKIIVTGAAQGIGRAVALRLAAPGATIAVWDVLEDAVEDTAKLCKGQGAVARAYTVDVGHADQIEKAVAAFESEWGKPSGLVNNAGIFPRARALDMKLEEWDVRAARQPDWHLHHGSRCRRADEGRREGRHR
jgi:NAD(P)-dependent dehydrogenase (short-subunit alcohol dehydrogenase family)